MEEIIVIRAIDPDENVFQTIMVPCTANLSK